MHIMHVVKLNHAHWEVVVDAKPFQARNPFRTYLAKANTSSSVVLMLDAADSPETLEVSDIVDECSNARSTPANAFILVGITRVTLPRRTVMPTTLSE
jgi:hypothetical protein